VPSQKIGWLIRAFEARFITLLDGSDNLVTTLSAQGEFKPERRS
jgi:hypothetical protein